MATLNEFLVEVDWDGDDSFDHAETDITADVLFCMTRRGRDYASQLQGRSSAGRCEVRLQNRDGKYSRFNSSSPLYGLLLPNRKVRVKSMQPTEAVLWTGFLDNILPATGALPEAVLTASGPFKKLVGQNALVSPPPLKNVTTGDIVDAILDAAGWPAGARDLATGDVEVKAWYVEQGQALGRLQEVEDTELGFLCEGLDWDVVFQNRYYRQANSLSSQGTFSDAAAASLPYLVGIAHADPLREIFNLFEATIQPVTFDTAPTVLWQLVGEQLVIPAGDSRTLIATVGEGVAFVDDWVTPVVGTDILQSGVSNGDLDVTVSETARTLFITIENTHGSAAATITLLQARGYAARHAAPYKVSRQDDSSIAAYERRTWPLASPWYHNVAWAESSAGLFLDRFKDPHPAPLVLPVPAGTQDSLFAQAVQRDLSQRITVVATGPRTKLGISGDFYIEAITHRWGARQPLETVWELSSAEPDHGYFIVGTDELNDNDKVIAY